MSTVLQIACIAQGVMIIAAVVGGMALARPRLSPEVFHAAV